jgi:hypothetical protein
MPSSVIDFIAYEESRSELTVTFTTGKTYVYGLVPKRVYEDFRGARSKGNYFNNRIRDRYPTRQKRAAGKSSETAQDWNAALENLKKR